MEHRLIQGGEQFLPFARSCVAKLKKLGIPYADQSFEIDGVSIKVRIEPGHEYIRIEGGGVYMESGIQDLIGTLPGFASAYKPAVVLFPPRVAGLSGVGKDKLANSFGRKLTSGDLSWSATGDKQSKLVDTATVYLGSSGEPTTFTDENKVFFEDPSRGNLAKVTSELIPPSVFTGKLKLFIQALYGSLRRDYKKVTSSNGVSALLAIDTGETYTDANQEVHKIYHHLTSTMPTSGLMTVVKDNGRRDYLLITIGTEEVTFAKTKKLATFTSRGVHSAEEEAYILAGLVPNATKKLAIGPVPSEVAKGGPIAYGWHFNESGSQASIVMTEGADIDGVRIYDMAPSTIRGVKNTLYTMTFAYDREKDVLTYSVSSGVSNYHIPYLQTSVFTPGITGGMELMMPGSPTPWNCYENLGPTPIYCFYDMSDTLHVINVTNSKIELAPAVSTITSPTDPVAIFGTNNVTMGGVQQFASGGGYVWPPAGVSSSLFSHTGTSTVNTGGSTVVNISLVGGDSTIFPGPQPEDSVTLISTTASRYISRSLSEGSKGFKPVLVIPFGDASAVIAGKRINTARGGVISTLQYTFGNNSAYSTTRADLIPLHWGGPYVGVMRWEESSPGLTPEEVEAMFPLAPSTTEQRDLWIYSNAGVTPLKSYSSSSTSPNPGDPPYTGLFFANNTYPTYQASMTVRTSYFGELMHSDTMGVIADNPVGGWPAGGKTPTGWA